VLEEVRAAAEVLPAFRAFMKQFAPQSGSALDCICPWGWRATICSRGECGGLVNRRREIPAVGQETIVAVKSAGCGLTPLPYTA
jgi:hypothetical protein